MLEPKLDIDSVIGRANAPLITIEDQVLASYDEEETAGGGSLIVAACTTALALLLGTPAAYALARFEFRGKKDLWFWFITNRMVSPIVLALPFFLIVRKLGMLDTHLILILIYLTFVLINHFKVGFL